MKAISALILTMISLGSWAQAITLPDGIDTEGELVLNCNKNRWAPKANSRLEVVSWAEGKIKVSLSIGATKIVYDSGAVNASQEASLHFIGIDNGSGAYDLFLDIKDMQTPVGELLLVKTGASIKFFKDMNGIIIARENIPIWKDTCGISKSSPIRFTAVVPTCFNKRGKQIDCPEIKF